jgi:nucleotide-binding universal stress UspA family protein
MFTKILLATDGSVHSLRAAEKAVALAKNKPDAQIVVLYVVDGKTSKQDVLQSRDIEGLNIARQKKIEGAISKVLNTDINLEYEIKIIRGEEPGPTIVKYANENNIDVIVIGSRGLNSLQEFVLGSVSHKVAKRANCPVLIVK